MFKEDRDERLGVRERLKLLIKQLRALLDQGREVEVLDILANVAPDEELANAENTDDAGPNYLSGVEDFWNHEPKSVESQEMIPRSEDDQEAQQYLGVIGEINEKIVGNKNVLPKDSIWNWEVISDRDDEASTSHDLVTQRSVANYFLNNPLLLTKIDLYNDDSDALAEEISSTTQASLNGNELFQSWNVDQVFSFPEEVRVKPNNLFAFLIQLKNEVNSRVYLGGIMKQATQTITEHLPSMNTQRKATACLLTEPGFTSGTVDMVQNEPGEVEFLMKMRPSYFSCTELTASDEVEFSNKMMSGSREPVSMIFKEQFARHIDSGLYDMLSIAHERFHMKFYEIVGLDKLVQQSVDQKQESKYTLAGALHEGFALFCEFELVNKMMTKANQTGDTAMFSQLGFYLKQRMAELGELNPYYQDGFKIAKKIMEGKDAGQIVEVASSINWQKAYQQRVGSEEYESVLDDPQQLLESRDELTNRDEDILP